MKNSDYKCINLDELVFVDDWTKRRGFFEKYFWKYRDRFANWLLPSQHAASSPIKISEKIRSKDLFAYLCKIGAVQDLIAPENIAYHQRRMNLLAFVEMVIFLILSFTFPFFMSVVFAVSFRFWANNDFWGISNEVLIFLVSFLSSFLISFLTSIGVVMIGEKITRALTRKRFADTLSLLGILYCIIELGRDEVLTHPSKKRVLRMRLVELATNTFALQYRYRSKDNANQMWISELFKRLQLYILERERWVVSPLETTLADLRKDLYYLAKIYFPDKFGKFDWSTVLFVPEPPATSYTKRTFLFLSKFFAVVLPLTGLGYLLFNPELLPAGITPSVVWIIFISWLLLSLDTTLKLGVVSGVVNLAKEIKNLT